MIVRVAYIVGVEQTRVVDALDLDLISALLAAESCAGVHTTHTLSTHGRKVV